MAPPSTGSRGGAILITAAFAQMCRFGQQDPGGMGHLPGDAELVGSKAAAYRQPSTSGVSAKGLSPDLWSFGRLGGVLAAVRNHAPIHRGDGKSARNGLDAIVSATNHWHAAK